MTDPVRELVLERASSSVIFRQAREDGMITLREDGWRKIVVGITTIEEIVRETQE